MLSEAHVLMIWSKFLIKVHAGDELCQDHAQLGLPVEAEVIKLRPWTIEPINKLQILDSAQEPSEPITFLYLGVHLPIVFAVRHNFPLWCNKGLDPHALGHGEWGLQSASTVIHNVFIR